MEQSSASLAAVLKDALSLSVDDRRRLTEVMQRVAPAGMQSPGSAEAEPVSPQPGADLQGWLERTEAETAWTRLLLLEDALEHAETDDELAALTRARRALLDANPPVAMRRAVVELATDHPAGTAFGVLGIVLAIATLGRGAIRLVF